MAFVFGFNSIKTLFAVYKTNVWTYINVQNIVSFESVTVNGAE